ncbi:mandelate racemase/muconate lactonizing enzyme family protein [Achromobacter aloeverae]|uniref:Mandelate racemase/muconate lactonizing enzyme family protein n=1 Tax=Achromobacter aloeverae TaxID=1750518 RepID=A0A4Q1HRC8_9BURK|nr:mandelate racemase/muconate lactonizing enzyme family protein [Achromobacter aloeverae]RXN93387.1 mandelate racemase/muconate lactonizing enzyme family protein [Achromobacter aloeverae]
MKITDVQLREIRAQLPLAFSGGTYSLDSRSALICRISTDTGITAEVVAGNEFSYPDYLKDLVRGPFRDLLLGQDPLRTEHHWRAMLRHDKAYIDRESLMVAIAVVDTALWDLRGRILGQPLWKMLGGFRQRVPLIGIGGYYETSRDAAGIRDEIAFYRRSGLAGIKFKVGALALDEDIERVRIAREAAGPAFAIVVDSNMAWRPDDAERFARAIAPYDPAWLEEPVHPRNVTRGLRQVRHKTGVRVGAGQSEASVFDAYELLAQESVDVLNVTYNRGGGISGWIKLAGAASFVDVSMAQVGEPHISMHLMAGIANGTYVECYPDPKRDPLWAELYLDRPQPVDGFLTVPDRPGLGLTLDTDVVERYAVEAWS